MQLKKLLPLSLGAIASAQNLTEVLSANNSTLSSLNNLLSTQPALVATLASLTNITILAPSNDAIATLLNSTAGTTLASDSGAVAALLTYHVLNGTYLSSAVTNTSQFIPTLLTNSSYANVTGGQRVEVRLNGTGVDVFSGLLGESRVTTANLNFTGGVIHVIDRLLTLPQSDSATAAAANLTSLAGALAAAGLVSTVDSLRDVTIFAPSNSAFQAIGSALTNLTTEQLSSILTYHVVNSTLGYSSGLTNTTLRTVNGESLTVTVVNGSVYVNSARVITPDVLVANGVVHVIDGVLNPNNTSASPPTTTASSSSGSTPSPTVAFSGASSVSDVPFTSGVTASTTLTSTPTRASSSSSSGFAGRLAMPTGAAGMRVLFGAAAGVAVVGGGW